MLISNAYAQAASGAGATQSSLFQFLPLVMIGLVFYFLLLRPQQQQAKQLKATLAALRRGDRVVTGGGIIATISKVISDEELEACHERQGRRQDRGQNNRQGRGSQTCGRFRGQRVLTLLGRPQRQ